MHYLTFKLQTFFFYLRYVNTRLFHYYRIRRKYEICDQTFRERKWKIGRKRVTCTKLLKKMFYRLKSVIVSYMCIYLQNKESWPQCTFLSIYMGADHSVLFHLYTCIYMKTCSVFFFQNNKQMKQFHANLLKFCSMACGLEEWWKV